MNIANCPKCGSPKSPGLECPQCGVIYAKAEQQAYNEKRQQHRGKQEQDIPPKETNKKKFSLKTGIITTIFVVLALSLSVYAGIHYQKTKSDPGSNKSQSLANTPNKEPHEATETSAIKEYNSAVKAELDRKKQQKLDDLQRESDRLAREISKREADLKNELESMRLSAIAAESKRTAKREIEVSEIYTKTLRRDSIGNIYISIKVTAKNNKNSSKVFIRLQGVDSEGFAIEDKLISGNIAPGSTESLTDTACILEREYKKIKNWRVAE